MKSNNLKKLSNISQEILNTMIIFENKNEGIVYVPKHHLDNWQRELFKIVKDEDEEKSH